MTTAQKEAFFQKLEGPEGCAFKDDPQKGPTWKCQGGMDKSFSQKILKEMGIPTDEANAFLEECDSWGGHCDCEIIFNAMEHML